VRAAFASGRHAESDATGQMDRDQPRLKRETSADLLCRPLRILCVLCGKIISGNRKDPKKRRKGTQRVEAFSVALHSKLRLPDPLALT
jgi:hypothetical protein